MPAPSRTRPGDSCRSLWPALALIIGLPLVVWALGGAPTTLDVPKIAGFNFAAVRLMSPEFTALLIGLYDLHRCIHRRDRPRRHPRRRHGQTEASMALGLTPGQRLRLVTLPQALRVIVPPMTSQYLNLTKNSSLGVAIGYPDLVAVANTTMNQTGQAIEAIAITMGVYLFISLLIAFAMNWYNNRVRPRRAR